MIHEHTDINRIRDDIDELIMDEHAIFTLTVKEQEQRAKRLEIDSYGALRGSHDPKFVHWVSVWKNCVRTMKLVLSRPSTG
ncbi:type I site-specific deoxyribonuclease, HsdR family [Salmonella enterica subsp. enterica]|uniref:Type I site-specific deoxyribonuclease, HsdR family n=1 Tax=Salmonella enterica I TaxID=59201 RepID=A0A379X1P9_SALET|nr:type I site-specific deoxyribonuclease, HsdR family [Salmonella enterica subsp. enterica]